MNETKPSEITSEQTFTAAFIHRGSYNHGTDGRGFPLRIWDDGVFESGCLFVIEEPFGNFGRVIGIVRAMNFEDAHDCAVDEILDDGDHAEYLEAARDQGIAFDGSYPIHDPEGYYHRGSGEPSNDGLSSFLAQADPGWMVSPLTDARAEELEISIFSTED